MKLNSVKFFGACAALSGLLTGCQFGGPEVRSSRPATALDTEVAQADRYARESRTLSNLAILERGVSDFIKTERTIPDSLEDLVPKYLVEIPAVELGLREHQDIAKVQDYSPLVIRDGVIDGSRIKDTARWGYAHNTNQVIIFVDCTHFDSRGKPWYQERGVF